VFAASRSFPTIFYTPFCYHEEYNILRRREHCNKRITIAIEVMELIITFGSLITVNGVSYDACCCDAGYSTSTFIYMMMMMSLFQNTVDPVL
jgi:hypothetical protein